MHVIATAGHVDHGKSTLVRALTGTDPDRLAEEKKRGLTIDLGFAGFDLPSGERVAFVDVPGHRRFIGNMLAGLGPAPVVMFVVAADQGWQAQSREHLDAVDALGLSRGLLVLTRCGLADEEQIASVRAEARRHMAATSLGAVDVVETDARAGLGITALVEAIDHLVSRETAPERAARAQLPVRLWVDRAFTVTGTGTVVTGTLGQGTIRVADSVEVDGRPAVVRSLQVLGDDVDEAEPVSRVAVGLRGLARADVPRGTLLATAGSATRASVVDVRRRGGLPWAEASPEVTVHVGTAAAAAHVRPFDDVHARLTFDAPLPLRLGDHLIVRDASAARIHCSAEVLDVEPLALNRRGAGRRRAQQLEDRRVGDLAALADDRGCVEASWLRAVGAADADAVPQGLSQRGVGRVGGFLVSARQAVAWRGELLALAADDARDALSAGLPARAVTGKLGVPESVVGPLVTFAGLRLVDGRVVGERHGASLGAAEAGLERLRERLTAHPFDAPEADDLGALHLGPRQIATAAQRGVVLRLLAQPADIVLLPDAPARAMRVLAALPQPFTTSEARQALGTTRRVVIPLLEHLDGRGWTRREGNARSVVR